MAKSKQSLSFSKAVITFEENGEILITETAKDDTKVYNLLEKLREFAGVEGIGLSISSDSEIQPIE